MRNKGRFILTITLSTVMTFGLLGTLPSADAESNPDVVNRSKKMVPSPPWPQRIKSEWPTQWAQEPGCGVPPILTNPKSKSYEISTSGRIQCQGLRFGVPLKYKYRPTASVLSSQACIQRGSKLRAENQQRRELKWMRWRYSHTYRRCGKERRHSRQHSPILRWLQTTRCEAVPADPTAETRRRKCTTHRYKRRASGR